MTNEGTIYYSGPDGVEYTVDYEYYVASDCLELEAYSVFDENENIIDICDNESKTEIEEQIALELELEHQLNWFNYEEDRLAAEGDRAYDSWKDEQYG